MGEYLPEKILTNADLEKMVDTSDEWITTRTGIKERHLAAKGRRLLHRRHRIDSSIGNAAGEDRDDAGHLRIE